MTPRLVVARYNEDLSWVPEGLQVTIYNKGEPIERPCIQLPNVGRETQTYLHHIVCNYEANEPLIFCQGNPLDHDPYFLERIKFEENKAFGMVLDCDRNGGQQVQWCPMHEYCTVLGLPRLSSYRFIAGAQFRACAHQIRSRPLHFWKALLALSELPESSVDGMGGSVFPWVFERLVPQLFALHL